MKKLNPEEQNALNDLLQGITKLFAAVYAAGAKNHCAMSELEELGLFEGGSPTNKMLEASAPQVSRALALFIMILEETIPEAILDDSTSDRS